MARFNDNTLISKRLTARVSVVNCLHSGCRAGKDCKFLHPVETEAATDEVQDAIDISASPSAQPEQPHIYNQRTPNASKVVARPIPKAQTEDPRMFQIGQMRRRFKPDISELDGKTTMSFKMKPSDPDFPYDIDELECVVTAPDIYPASGKPTLTIKNKDIPRGFQINIERGFDTIAANAPEATLLGLMNRLDKQLETILAGRMAETVKIVSNKSHATAQQVPKRDQQQSQQAKQQPVPARQTPTSLQMDEARVKRQTNLRQLEARFGRLQSYAKSSDGLTYTLPLDSPKRSTWPVALLQLRSVHLIVPESYPLESPGLRLDSASDEARAVEEAFQKYAETETSASLTQLVNYLSQHLKEMAMSKPVDAPSALGQQLTPEASTVSAEIPASLASTDNDKSHVHYIPRPPEWDYAVASDDSDEGSSDASDYDSEDEDEDDAETSPAEQQTSASTPAERGILLSFPHLELHGIELLELTSLNITVKCERCKGTMDIERLRTDAENSKMREESCKKCASTFAIRFRADMIHANSVRGGYLDLDGCTVVDMLSSNFIPTCSECSTAYPASGVTAVRGDTAMAICRECHRKMTMRIQEVKFLQISASAMRASRVPGRKKVKENLGITAGTALPRQGRCAHYRKSYRWFRFSCCQKVFPCDRCHDEQTDHPNEHANRMIW